MARYEFAAPAHIEWLETEPGTTNVRVQFRDVPTVQVFGSLLPSDIEKMILMNSSAFLAHEAARQAARVARAPGDG